MNTFITEIIFPFFTIGITILLLMVILNIPRIVKFLNPAVKTLHLEEAEAVIIDMQQTGLFIDDAPEIKLQMQVIPNKGRNFIMETNHVVSEKDMDHYKSGNRIKVKYAADNHHEMKFR